MVMDKALIRIPLEGAGNVRDLGGYAGEENKVGKFGVFLRGNTLENLSKKDNEFLKNYGVTDIIDLRSEEAVSLKPDSIDKDDFNYHIIPLLNMKFNENLILEKENFNMGEGYKYILENKAAIKLIFEALAKSKGATLFHCTAGKDRTGLVSMLILGVCGVSRKDIVANYEVSYTYVPLVIDGILDNPSLVYSLPEYIESAIDYIEEKFVTYYDYLKACDISDDVIEKIKEKYLD